MSLKNILIYLIIFILIGELMIRFDESFTILEENNYEGWMVVEAEQDPAKANPFVYAKMARDYIRTNTGI